MPTAITIDRLTKVFGAGPGRTTAVDEVCLEIRPGELFFLLGPSGCGKTTLLRMLAGFVEPTSGRILFDGRNITRLPANRRNTGMVFQSYALWPHMTVEANVAFGLRVRRVPRAARAERTAEALRAVHMLDYARRRPNELSGGQQQRIALARALVVRPDVLLLDEPLSNLDARLRADLRAEIRRICKEFQGDGTSAGGITTVYVTHDQKEALSMADRIAILNRGRVVQLGTPRDLYRRPGSRFVAEFLGETNLIPGRVLERAGARAGVDTPLGRLLAGPPHADAGVPQAQPIPAAAQVLCSIRPESFFLDSENPKHPKGSENRFPGRIVESTYQGDSVQHIVQAGTLRLRVTAMNSEPADARNRAVTVAVDPSDVVLLPTE